MSHQKIVNRCFGLLTLLACALCTSAGEVTPEMAKTAVQNWRARRDPMGCRFGARAASARRCEVGGAKFNVVKMEKGGFVVTSADTAIRPIVFFGDGDDVDENPNNPLYVLLQRDLEVCAKAAADEAATAAGGGATLASVRPGGSNTGTSGTAVTSGTTGANEQAWAELLAEPKATLAAVTPSDIRVGPLCATTWDQGSVGGKRVYNYYTPSNYVCGCVATAASQIIRTFEWPRSEVNVSVFSNIYCYVAGVNTTCTALAGHYVWSDMPLNPNSSITETQQRAIGKLCYDVGVGVAMGWSSGGGSSNTIRSRHLYRNIFGYSQALIAYFKQADNKASSSALTRKAFITNFDAKLPVHIGVADSNGGNGHSIVADGYGYSGTNICYHLNYGWSGGSNGWYCPPTLGTGYNYTIINNFVYNIYTNQPADKVILSGRLLGTNGKAAVGKTVEARQGSTVAATTTTDAKGIFALYVSPSQTYTVRSVGTGQLAQTTGTTTAIKSVDLVVDRGMVTGSIYTSNMDADICNATVGDVQFVSTTPVARIGSTDYYSFTEACRAATSGQTVTLLQNVEETVTLTVPATVDFDGHTLTGEFYVQNTNGTVTLQNGTITGTAISIDGKDGSEDTFPNGTVRLEDMTVTGTILSDSHPLVFDGGTYTGEIRSGSQVCTILDGYFASLVKEGEAAFAISGGRFVMDNTSISTLPNEYYRFLQDDTNVTYPWYVTGAIDYARPTLADDATPGTNFTSAVVTCSVDIPYRGTDVAAKLRVIATAANGRAYTNLVALAAGAGTQNVSTTFAALSPAASYGVTAEVIFGDGSTLKDVTMDAEVIHAARKIGGWIDEDATTFQNNSKWTVPSGATGEIQNGKILLYTDLTAANAVSYTPTPRPYDCASEVTMRMNMMSLTAEQLPTLAAGTKVAVTSVIDGGDDFFAVWSSGAWTQTTVPCAIGRQYDMLYMFDYVECTVDISAMQVGSADTVWLGRYSFTDAAPFTQIDITGYSLLSSIDGDSWNAKLVRGANGVEYATLEQAVAAGVTSVTLLWDATWNPNSNCRLQVLNPENKGLAIGSTQLPRGSRVAYDAATQTYVVTSRGALLILF